MTDERLAELLRDAVSDVEPRDRLEEVRARTADRSRPAGRSWFYGAGAAVLATAAAVTVVAVVRQDAREPGPAQEPPTRLVAAYYLGSSPSGPRLFREFDRMAASDPLDGALSALQGAPSDPDYRTGWPDGSLEGASHPGRTIDVVVGDVARARPTGLTDQEAKLSVQQAVYTVQAAVQSQDPVRFLRDGRPVGTVLGVPVSEPVARSPQLEVLGLVNVSDPAEGTTVSGSFTARGRASSFEATVPWELRRSGKVVRKGFATAEGWVDRLYPWQTRVDVSGLEPGEYTFVAMTDDPSGGEGGGPSEDTRTIMVE